MSAPLLLTPEELVELTGYRQHAAQLRWLAANLKIKAPIRADGMPVVTRQQLEAAVGPAAATVDDDAGEFNWSKP